MTAAHEPEVRDALSTQVDTGRAPKPSPPATRPGIQKEGKAEMNTLMKTPTGPLVEARRHLEDALALGEVAAIHNASTTSAFKAKGTAQATTSAAAKSMMAEVAALRRENRELAEAVKLMAQAVAMAKGRNPENADALAGEIMRRFEGPAQKTATTAPPVEAAPLPDLSIRGTVGGASGGGGLLGLPTCDHPGCWVLGPWSEATTCPSHRGKGGSPDGHRRL